MPRTKPKAITTIFEERRYQSSRARISTMLPVVDDHLPALFMVSTRSSIENNPCSIDKQRQIDNMNLKLLKRLVEIGGKYTGMSWWNGDPKWNELKTLEKDKKEMISMTASSLYTRDTQSNENEISFDLLSSASSKNITDIQNDLKPLDVSEKHDDSDEQKSNSTKPGLAYNKLGNIELTPKKIHQLFVRFDDTNTKRLSLAKIDKAILQLCPEISVHKGALMRAYKSADKSGDGFIEEFEFVALLLFITYYDALYKEFEKTDLDKDKRIDFEEFKKGYTSLGFAEQSEEELKKLFDSMDLDKGGFILFYEFCSTMAKLSAKQLGFDKPEVKDAALTSKKRALKKVSKKTDEKKTQGQGADNKLGSLSADNFSQAQVNTEILSSKTNASKDGKGKNKELLHKHIYTAKNLMRGKVAEYIAGPDNINRSVFVEKGVSRGKVIDKQNQIIAARIKEIKIGKGNSKGKLSDSSSAALKKTMWLYQKPWFVDLHKVKKETKAVEEIDQNSKIKIVKSSFPLPWAAANTKNTGLKWSV